MLEDGISGREMVFIRAWFCDPVCPPNGADRDRLHPGHYEKRV